MSALTLPTPTYAVIDLETTGSNREVHEIVDIAIVWPELKDVAPWHTRVRPEHPELAVPRALEVNGYNPHDWADAPLLCEVAIPIHQMLRGLLLVGHNAKAFDVPFLRGKLEPFGLHKDVGLEVRDTYLMARGILHGLLPRYRLADVCTYFGVPVETDAHGALGGAVCAAAIYQHLLRRSGQPNLL